jgi:hypothetical protein
MDLTSLSSLSLPQSRQLSFLFGLASVIPPEFSLKHSIAMSSSSHGLNISESFVASPKLTTLFLICIASVIPPEFSLKHSIAMSSSSHGLNISEFFVASPKLTTLFLIWFGFYDSSLIQSEALNCHEFIESWIECLCIFCRVPKADNSLSHLVWLLRFL